MAGNDGDRLQPYRNHALFPVLEYISGALRDNQKTLVNLQQSVAEIKGTVTTIREVQDELRSLIKESNKNSFSLKAFGYDKILRTELATKYCESLTRVVTDAEIQSCVKKVLRNDATVKHKFDIAVKFLKQMLSTFKTEERRRVYGIAPCQRASTYSTHKLASSILDYLRGPERNLEIYKKNLALLRKFIRDEPSAREEKHFYQAFRRWIDANNPINWDEVLEEDAAYDYSGASTSNEDGVGYDNSDMVLQSESLGEYSGSYQPQ